MAEGESLGFVETYGLTAAIETADAMVKAARVRVRTVLNADLGLLSVVCEGDLAACKAAVEAGKASAERLGNYVSSNLIARPDADTDTMIVQYVHTKIMPEEKSKPKAEETSPKGQKTGGKGKK